MVLDKLIWFYLPKLYPINARGNNQNQGRELHGFPVSCKQFWSESRWETIRNYSALHNHPHRNYDNELEHKLQRIFWKSYNWSSLSIEFLSVFWYSRPCSQSHSTTRTILTIPIYKDFTYITSFLARCIAILMCYRFCLVSITYSFANHFSS